MTTMTPQSSDDTEEKVTTVIADDLNIKGTITFESSLMIKGTLEGEIISEGLLVVGPTAKIGATIVTKSLVSHGQIQGDVTASERVVLKGTSVQTGNITTPYIVVEHGSVFNGSCVMKREAGQTTPFETPSEGGGEQAEAAGTVETPAAESTAVTEEEATVPETATPAEDNSYGSSENEQAAGESAIAGESVTEEETAAKAETAVQVEETQGSRQSSEDAIEGSSQQAAGEAEGQQKTRDDSGNESHLRSKWRRRELF